MASSKPREDLEVLSNKINAALAIVSDCKSGASTQDECDNSNFPSYSEMFDEFLKEFSEDNEAFQSYSEFIAPEFPFRNLIRKSKVLDDEELFKAVLLSNVFNDVTEFQANRHKYEGELVWLTEYPDSSFVDLVFQNRIIYRIESYTVQKIRYKVQKPWAIMKEKIEKNLIDAFSMVESTENCNDQLVSHLPSNDSAVGKTSSTSDTRHIEYPMSDGVKINVLKELNELNLNASIKLQFAFDLKLLADRDMLYWRERLNSLRLYSSKTVASSSESAKLQMSQISAKFEKKVDLLVSLAEQFKLRGTVDNQFSCEELQKLPEIISECKFLTTEMEKLVEFTSSSIESLLTLLLQAVDMRQMSF